MKIFLAIILFPALAFGQSLRPSPSPSPASTDLVTLSGKVYKSARRYRVEPDGITYMFSGGMVKIPFTDLPEAIRKEWQYDPNQAAAFSRQDEAVQSQAQAANHAEALKTQAQREAAIKADEERRAAEREASTQAAPSEYHNPLDEAAVRRDPVNGDVLQITESGILVARGSTVVLLEDYPGQDRVIDNAKVRTIGQLVGSFEYDTVGGGTSRIKRYHYISGTVTNPR